MYVYMCVFAYVCMYICVMYVYLGNTAFGLV